MLTSRFSIFLSPYDVSNEHCQWVLTAMVPTHMLQIESVATDLVNWDGGDCEDYLAVYDGEWMTSWPF